MWRNVRQVLAWLYCDAVIALASALLVLLVELGRAGPRPCWLHPLGFITAQRLALWHEVGRAAFALLL